MAHKVLTDAKIWLAEYDLSGDMNAVAIDYGVNVVDDTMFGDTTEVGLGGVRQVALEASGHVEEASSGSGDALFTKLGATDIPLSVSPDGQTAGEVAYTFKALEASYNPNGEHGEAFAFTVSATGAGELVRGTIMVSPASAITATGNSTARQLGAVAADEKVYAALHVIAASGTTPTLDVVVQSDDAQAFTTATGRITFTQATGVTSEWLSADGAITDDWWRISYTLGGTNPSFTFLVVTGIK